MRIYLLLLLALSFFGSLAAQQNHWHADGDALDGQAVKPLSGQPGSLVAKWRSSLSDLPAGDAIEGDFIGQMIFSPDGEQVWILHRLTDNITVFDFQTKAILANIEAGDMPLAIAMTDSFAIVAAYNDNAARIIRLADFSTAAVIPTAAQPCFVKTSPGGQYAYVSCDEGDVCEMINLATLEKERTISDFPVFLQKFSFITSNTRSTIYYSSFGVAPDNSYLINGGGDQICFYETATGQQIDCLADYDGLSHIGLSGDGGRFVAVASLGMPNSQRIIQIDVASRVVTAEVPVPAGLNVYSLYSDLAVNADGSKAYIPLSGNQSGIVRFANEDVQILSSPRTPSWMAASPDHQYAISGGYYLSVIDFNTDAVVNQLPGRPIQNGAVAAQGNRFVAADPLRYEGIYFYNYNNPAQIQFEDELLTGSELEADASYSVQFTPDEQKAIVVNSISRTISVIDMQNEQLEAIVPLGASEIYHVTITHDSRYALIAQRQLNQVAIVDLESYEVVAAVPSGGEKPDNIVLSQDGQQAYVLNAGGADRIGLLQVDGANSSLDLAIDGGNTGVSWTNFGIRSEMRIHPEGAIGLVAASFSDAINVIDLENKQLGNSISIEGFALQIAYSSDGQFAAVTLKNEGAVALLYIENGAVALAGRIENIPNPTRISYDPVAKLFAVCSQDDGLLYFIDPMEQQLVDTESFANRTPIAVDFHSSGRRYLLLRSDDSALPHQIHFGEEVYEFEQTPIHHFAHSSSGKWLGVCLLGADRLLVASGEPVGLKEIALHAVYKYHLYPNPAKDRLRFEPLAEPLEGRKALLSLYNAQGRLLKSIGGLSVLGFDISVADLPQGSYGYRLNDKQGALLGSGTFLINR